MSSNLKVLERTVEKFKTKIENLNPSDDASRCQDEVEQLEEIQKNIEDLIETLENDAENDEDFANQKPLINKFEEQKKLNKKKLKEIWLLIMLKKLMNKVY